MEDSRDRTHRWTYLLSGLSIFVLILLGGCWGWLAHLRCSLTDSEVGSLPVVQVTDRERQALLPKYQRLEADVRASRRAEIQLSGEELDKLIATVDRFKALRGRVSIRLEGEHAWITASLPLKKIPFLENRFLNGVFKVSAHLDGDQYDARILEGRNGAGEAYPHWLLAQLNKALETPETVDALLPGVRKHVETLRIAGGKLLIRTRRGK